MWLNFYFQPFGLNEENLRTLRMKNENTMLRLNISECLFMVRFLAISLRFLINVFKEV